MPAPQPLYLIRKLYRNDGVWCGSTTGLHLVPAHEAGDWWPRYAADDSLETNGAWCGSMSDAERLGHVRGS